MLDNQIITLLITTIVAQEAVAAIPGLPIVQAFQPRQQGVNKAPTAFIHKVGDRRMGYPYISYSWQTASDSDILLEGDADSIILEGSTSPIIQESGALTQQMLQQYESTFQISALATQNPATPESYTASDILNLIATILQSPTTVATLEAQGVGIERISDLRNPYFLDDRERHEASPSMDLVITHKRIIYSPTPIVGNIQLDINRV